MSGTVFVDKNVLVYRRDRADAQKNERALEWIEQLWRTRTGRLSIQVLLEVINPFLHPPSSVFQAKQ